MLTGSNPRRFGRFLAAVLACLLGGFSAAAAKPLVVCDDVSDPTSLNPLRVFSDKGHNIIQQIFDGLVHFDSEGRIEPALAVSWEQRDPLTMRFHLREGVRFHDGEPFNAESVRFTLERLLDPASNFPGWGFISTIDRVVVVDPQTVDIVTRIPDSLLLRRLAGFVFIMPPEAYAKDGFEAHPIGTGPYRFARWTKGKEIELKPNPEYWERGDSAPEEVTFRFVPVEKQLDLLLLGELDLVTELPGTATLPVSRNPDTHVVKKAAFYTLTTTFNNSRSALKDARVRQAMNYAINKEELIRYDLMGNGLVIAGLSMPGEIGHNPDLKPYEYDPGKARKLLAEAGVPLPLKLRTLTRAQGERTARIIAKQLQAVGIELDVYGVTTDADAIRDMSQKNLDIGIASLPDVMGHIFFLQSIVLYSKSPFSLQADPEYDRRLEAMVTELDEEKHERMAKDLDRYVHEQAMSLFTYQRIRTYGLSRGVDFVPSTTGRLYLHRVKMTAKPSNP
ncbi:MAG: ABC transporter substrate-binding protein [Elusimicrobia bacterium]|nr:ABC transporter substrate-binding protein [Elusimicrobiota bacterium]